MSKMKNSSDMRLYHKDVWFPQISKELNAFRSKKYLVSSHLIEHIVGKDKSHDYDSFDFYDLYLRFCRHSKEIEVFEVGFVGNILKKIVIRGKLKNSDNDMSLVVRKTKSYPILVTAWINSSSDDHATLDKSKYRKHW